MINDKPLNFGSTAPNVFRQTHSFSLRKAYPFTTNQDEFHNVSHVSGTRSHSNSSSSYCTSSGCWARIILGPHPKKGQAKWWAMTSKRLQEAPGIYLYMYICICTYMYIYINICMCIYIYMYVYMNIYVCKYIYICIFICISIYLSVCLSVFLSFCLSVFLSFCLSIYLSNYLSIYLSIYLIYLSNLSI